MLTRWQPWHELWSEMNRLQHEMNRVFGRYGDDAPSVATSYPPVNVWEDEDKLLVETELPGMNLQDLEIFVSGNQLTIKGERKSPTFENATWHRRERGYGTFSRVYELPEPVDADHVQAQFHNGVLRLELPKQEDAKPRRITVKAE
jgi:HSP20 family protein